MPVSDRKKVFGIRTGVVDGFTNSGKRVKWVPTSPLVLMAGPEFRRDLPQQIAANPPREEQLERALGEAVPIVRASARIFVGFNVADVKDVWQDEEVFILAYVLRERQTGKYGGSPGMSFYVGSGAFPGVGTKVKKENSAQIVVVNFDQPEKDFFRDMVNLSGDLAEHLSQESTLLELSKNGVVVFLDLTDADPAKWNDIEATQALIDANRSRVEDSVVV